MTVISDVFFDVELKFCWQSVTLLQSVCIFLVYSLNELRTLALFLLTRVVLGNLRKRGEKYYYLTSFY